jgi:hypothetical protein
MVIVWAPAKIGADIANITDAIRNRVMVPMDRRPATLRMR